MNEMSPGDKERSVRRDFWLAAMLIVAGLVTVGLSLAELRAQNRMHLAQATGTPGVPLQATPAPSPAPNDTPAESKSGGTRPTTPAPEPAQPSAEAQKEGARPALPPAPAEKMASPIPERK
jgi:hypothetical protein